jgi:hypothetical protein
MLSLAQPARAQTTTVLAVDGWRQEVRQDGTVYYRCASQVCAAGSVVSYKPQPHRPALTLADFENHHRDLAQHYGGTGNMRAVRVAEPKQRTIEDVRVLQISREVDWSDNTTTFSIEARLIGGDKSFSLVSDSPKREWTVNNFEGFLRSLVAISGINGRWCESPGCAPCPWAASPLPAAAPLTSAAAGWRSRTPDERGSPRHGTLAPSDPWR